MAFIRTISPEEARGPLRRMYDAAMNRAGYVAQVLRLMSLKPRTLKPSMDLYLAVMHGPSKLTRAQREMIAVAVSRANGCHY